MKSIIVEIEVNDKNCNRAFETDDTILLNYDESLYTPKVYDNIIYTDIDYDDIIHMSKILSIYEPNEELYQEVDEIYNLVASFRLPNIEEFCIGNRIPYDGVYYNANLKYINNSTIFNKYGISSIDSVSNSNIGFPIYHALKKQDIEEVYEISDKYISFMISKDKVDGFDACDSFTYKGTTMYIYIKYLNVTFDKLGIVIIDDLEKLSKFHD